MRWQCQCGRKRDAEQQHQQQVNQPSDNSVVRSSTSSSSTSTSTSSKKARTKDRLKRGNEGHIHSSEKPDVASSLRLSSSAFFASSAALVHPTCQAEERQTLAGSHNSVLRGNDAGISFAALDFRFIR
ncbi:uncharacterized protein LOC113566536 [Drosophila persimilis]|uniref:uncharacterized protein LOC113566536 n=1 Tax=Drosophila persimilis TaxID=7234 RepID=UPI000F090731|nr:uncharacterized protein LOC113566536 [Drosophila persimilis]